MCDAAWHARAGGLADWALARFFVRTDRYGGYYRSNAGGAWSTHPTTRPAERTAGAVTRSLLLRHFRATATRDVCGAHLLSEGASVGRCVIADLDDHDGTDTGANARHGEELHRRLTARGFRPLVARWGGSVHVTVLFMHDQPGPSLRRFVLELAPDIAGDRFPVGPECRAGGYGGGWCRVVGRHHTRDQWAEVYDGAAWLAGAPAVAHVLTLTGDDVTLEAPKPEPAPVVAPRPAPRRPEREVDVLAEYSRSQTLDDVCEMHARAGHALVRRSPNRAEFRRAGKGRGGESFNVQVIDGVPVTFNFSTVADLPAGRGLTPAHLRALAEYGACDAAALTRLADQLRLAAGLPPRRRAAPSSVPSAGPVEERLAALEGQIRELAGAVLDLQDQLNRSAYRVCQ